MSEYTREEILRLIEENGGPEGLNLSRKDLSGIDLGREAIQAELEKFREKAPNRLPVWFSEETRGINLQGAVLWHANLQEADLSMANLRSAFLWEANLREANLNRANLGSAFLEDANLQGAILWQANLQEANPSKANLQEANLGGANLQGAFLSKANLQGAILGDANLRETDLYGAKLQGAYLGNSHLEKVDFFVAQSLEGAYFYNAFLDDTRLKRDQLGEEIGEEKDERYGRAKEAYLALKNNFAEIGRYDDAAWAYRKERQMEKATKAPWRARGKRHYGDLLPFPAKVRRFWEELRELGIQPPVAYLSLPRWSPLVWWFWFKYTLKWLADWFVELLCGYGESLWRVLAWMLLVILGFAAYYQVSHAVVTSSPGAATSLWDHLIFSLGAFTTLQPARLQAARPGIELLTTIQAIIGISLAGLLGFVAGNRIRRS
jgi:uncharacterized protein YjbI with pentapeptide repeats